MKTIGIIGSRRRDTNTDYEYLYKIFRQYYISGDEIVSGGCPQGGDKFAEFIAKTYQIPIKIYYAEWTRLGYGAGFARNGLIARDSDILLAVVAPDRTGGSEDTIRKAMKMNKHIVLINKDSIEVINDVKPTNILEEFKI